MKRIEFYEEDVLPTHVGMSRSEYCLVRKRSGAPHTRGDEPLTPRLPLVLYACSPHTWG